MIGWRFLIPCLFLLGLLGSSPARAEDPPPSRVGRVAVIDGNVAVRRAGGEWLDGGVNDPVMSGMSVRTGPQGRAVLRIGAETIALAAGTEFDLTEPDARAVRIALRQGRIGVRLSPRTAARAGVPEVDPVRSVEIDTPRGGAWLLQPGDYDITAGDDHAPARVAASLDGAADDDFVEWWRPAAGDDMDAPALHYVSSDMTGYEALDGNGGWETVAGYGAVWFPQTIPDDWAPYRYGHWRWIAPWGWSWIDDMSWGFAPSHYGRWARISQSDPLDPADPGTERWGWVPGERVAQPVYAPALVAFLGTARVGLSYPDASGPAVAWFPLAPGEVYWPSYTGDLDVIRRINDGAVADAATIGTGVDGEPPADIVNGAYQNRRFASVVPRAVFVAGRPVAAALVRLPDERLENAPLLAGSPQIAPSAPRAVAAASAPVNRLADAAVPRLARAMHTLARILRPHGRTAVVRPAVLVRRAPARPHVTLATTGHWRAPGGRLVRPRVIAAVASRTALAHLRLAAAHRGIAR